MTDLKREEVRKNLVYIVGIIDTLERTERKVLEQQDYIEELRKENRKLKYEYADSLLKRDEPLPYKWSREPFFRQYCPKCEMAIANWQSYCHACGQKILKGNPEPEMEIKNDKTD